MGSKCFLDLYSVPRSRIRDLGMRAFAGLTAFFGVIAILMARLLTKKAVSTINRSAQCPILTQSERHNECCFCDLSNPSFGKESCTNNSGPLGFHSLDVAPLLRRFGLSRLRPIIDPSRSFCLRGLYNLVVKSLSLFVFF